MTQLSSYKSNNINWLEQRASEFGVKIVESASKTGVFSKGTLKTLFITSTLLRQSAIAMERFPKRTKVYSLADIDRK